MGPVMGRTLTSLSSSSQEQLPTEQQSQASSPSPQIRAFGPDGRHHNHDLLHAASSYPPSRGSRYASLASRARTRPHPHAPRGRRRL